MKRPSIEDKIDFLNISEGETLSLSSKGKINVQYNSKTRLWPEQILMCISSIVVKSCCAENSWVLVPISEDRTTTEKEKRVAIDFFTRQKKWPDRPSPPDPTRVIKRYQSWSRGRGCTTCRGQRWAQEVLKHPRPIASSCVDSGVKSRARSREPCGVVVARPTSVSSSSALKTTSNVVQSPLLYEQKCTGGTVGNSEVENSYYLHHPFRTIHFTFSLVRLIFKASWKHKRLTQICLDLFPHWRLIF